MINRIEETRRAPRIDFTGPLRCQVRGTPVFLNTLSDDISDSGIGFINNKFIPPQTTVMMEINIFARVLRPIGKIVWSSPFAHADKYRFGAQFLEWENSQDKKYLSDYINMKLNQA